MIVLLLALLVCGPTVFAADRAPRPHPDSRGLESEDPEDDPRLGDEDEGLEPSLPDDEPLGHGDEPEERLPSPPGVGPRSRPSLPDEDEEAPPAEVEPARSGAARPAAPMQPLAPGTQ